MADRPDTEHRDVGQLYDVARKLMVPVFNRAWKFHVSGLEHVPSAGGAIICPNHTSVLDSFFVPAVLPRRITYVGKAEYMDDWKTKHLFPALGMIPIDRSGGSASERALSAAARILEAGELFGIYPEGTRSRSGKLHKGHTGPARLALRTGCPIIPVGISGAREVMPPDAKFPKLGKDVRISFGRPITVDRYADRADDRLVLRQIIDEVMYEIRELSGQEYVNEYATKTDERLPTATATIPKLGDTAPLPVDTVASGNGNGNGHGEAEPSEVVAAAAPTRPAVESDGDEPAPEAGDFEPPVTAAQALRARAAQAARDNAEPTD